MQLALTLTTEQPVPVPAPKPKLLDPGQLILPEHPNLQKIETLFYKNIYSTKTTNQSQNNQPRLKTNMSTPVSNVENVEVVAQKVARVKKPSLPAKYSKFMSFGFWFLNKMEATVRDQLFPEIKLFSSIEEQSAFFQSYLDEASASNKIMRKTITAFHKPPKVRAEKKSRKTSKPVAAASDDLIEKLIAEANGDAAPAPAPTEEKAKKSKKSTKKTEEGDAPAEEKPKKEKKVADKPKKEKKTKEAPAEVVTEPAEPVATTDAPATEATAPVEKPKKEKKTAAKKTEEGATEEKPKKEKKAPAAKKSTKKEETPATEPAQQAPADDSDEIQTRIVTIEGGKQYLIDQDYNLYDINTHEEIGKFDQVTQQPILA